MKSKLIYDGPQRTFAVVLETGDEVLASLLRFRQGAACRRPSSPASGRCATAVLGYFDWQKKDYDADPGRRSRSRS